MDNKSIVSPFLTRGVYSRNFMRIVIFIQLLQVLSEFAPDSHSVRVPVTRVLHYVSSKLEVSAAFQF